LTTAEWASRVDQKQRSSPAAKTTTDATASITSGPLAIVSSWFGFGHAAAAAAAAATANRNNVERRGLWKSNSKYQLTVAWVTPLLA
jgi:hypothetical protein